jgi:tRNA-Thr(GGU) m(6)t(6)A37 methyltransferase TsaA
MTSSSDESAPEMRLRRVGIVRSQEKEPSLVYNGGDLDWRPQPATGQGRMAVSEMVIDDDLDGILDRIEEFSHLLVLYWAHCVPPEGRSLLRVHPKGRKDFPLVGVFADCSPARPNPICSTVVRLIEHHGNVLKVEGLDAVDGSPIIDIKPYNPIYYAHGEVRRAEWMDRFHKENPNV